MPEDRVREFILMVNATEAGISAPERKWCKKGVHMSEKKSDFNGIQFIPTDDLVEELFRRKEEEHQAIVFAAMKDDHEDPSGMTVRLQGSVDDLIVLIKNLDWEAHEMWLEDRDENTIDDSDETEGDRF
jgi:hypothetical protein